MSKQNDVPYYKTQYPMNLDQSISPAQNHAITLESLGDMAFILDMEGKIIYVNDAVIHVLKYPYRNLINKHIIEIHPPEYQSKASELIKLMLEDKERYCRYPLISNDGTYIPVETTVFKTTWYGKDVLIGISRNMAVVKKVFKQSSAGIELFNPQLFIYNLETERFVGITDTALKLLGFTKMDFLYQSINDIDIFHIPSQINQLREMINIKLSIKDFDLFVNSKQGLVFHLIVDINPFDINKQPYLFVTINQIERYGNKEAKIQHQMLQQRLLANVSQELNNPNFYDRLGIILKWIGEHTNVSRTYIFEDNKTGTHTNNTFEWCNYGIESVINDLQEIPYKIIPSWKNMLLNEGRVFSTDIYTLPEDLLAILEPQNIKSILVYPLYNQKDFYGFVGFDECARNKVWETDEVELLRLLSHIISNAFERRQMLNTILENETRLKLAIGNAREGVWELNIQTRKMVFDDDWRSNLGYEPGEIKDNFDGYLALIHPEDHILIQNQLEEHVLGKTSYFDCTCRMITKTGSIRWVQNKGKLVTFEKDKKTQRIVGKFNDLTQFKLAEESLIQTIHREKELNDLKSRFVSNASHEFRTPLANILITSDSLDEFWSKMSEDQIKLRIQKIKQQVIHLTGIVENVLQISQAQQGKMKFNPQNIDIVKLLKIIIGEFKEIAKENTVIEIIKNIDNCEIYADPEHIRQILNNLLSNSIKYSIKDPKIECHLIKKEELLTILVRDNGIGIPKNDQQYLFTPFFRASNTIEYTGNGLGLSIVNESVKLHGGKVKIYSNVGEGTTISISIPLTKSQIIPS
ncbi:MAG: PAS domain-containing protein [Bacteroidales bacterium]|nr:PAS domain-containing protein [Bacteroidales bacterium]